MNLESKRAKLYEKRYKLSRAHRIPDPYDYILGDFLIYLRVVDGLKDVMGNSTILDELVEHGYINSEEGMYWLTEDGIIEALQTREKYPSLTFNRGELPEDWESKMSVNAVLEDAKTLIEARKNYTVEVGIYKNGEEFE